MASFGKVADRIKEILSEVSMPGWISALDMDFIYTLAAYLVPPISREVLLLQETFA
jgi:hypothetical protein